jgi:Zn-finger nucleic acid-binding protein
MREVEKDGVNIDICPQCKGVWLDRGELEKLMSEVREERQVYNEWQDDRARRMREHDRDRDREHDRDAYYPPKGHSPYYPKKKKSVLDRLGDLFD